MFKNYFRSSLCLIALVLVLFACNKPSKTNHPVEEIEEVEMKPSVASVKAQLTEAGFKLFDYVDPDSGDTVIMQQYYIAFLKSGPNRSQSKEEADSLQTLHMEHLGKMYAMGYADISGPFDDESDIQGITIYNTPNLQMADSLANADPMVKAGRLVIEMHPWWAAKGFPLR